HSSMDLSPGSRPASDLSLSMGRSFQAVAHAAQGLDLRSCIDELLAQAMHQHLDRFQVDFAVVRGDAVQYLLLRYGFAAALYQHLQHGELAWRQRQGLARHGEALRRGVQAELPQRQPWMLTPPAAPDQ